MQDLFKLDLMGINCAPTQGITPTPSPLSNSQQKKVQRTINKIVKECYISPPSSPPKTLDEAISGVLDAATFIPPEIEMKEEIGKSTQPAPSPANTSPPAAQRIGLMWPRGNALKHEAAPLLERYSLEGCPVDCGRPWTTEEILAAIKRGPHITACAPEARACLIQETHDKVKEGFARLIKLGDIIDNIPRHLKISPVAMVPHKSRLFRCILDLSFALRFKGSVIESVNSTTALKAPQKAMAELGQVVQRLIITMADNYNPDRPFKFTKIDIKDGFWRMAVSDDDAWNFCYVIPPEEDSEPLEDRLIVVPNALQMGWRESPPFFCAATETARDVIQRSMDKELHLQPPHHLEQYMTSNTPLPPAPGSIPSATPDAITNNDINIMEVYVDDFIGGTNILDEAHLTNLSRAILHGVHSIFPPPEVSGHTGEDPVSMKKLKAGDGLWDFEKEILGWIFNGLDWTIRLPEDKVHKIQTLISETASSTEVPLKTYQTMAGKLNHATHGIPNGRGLFAPIYAAMKNDPDMVPLTPPLKRALTDWHDMLHIVKERPTHVLELSPGEPHYIGYVDACKSGIGGVWFSGTKHLPYHVWRLELPQDIQDNLVSESNPDGTITINDLEMAGVLLHWLALENILGTEALKHAHVGIYCDNTATVSWAYRLSSSSSIIAGHLLRALALRQHMAHTSPLLCVSVAGVHNLMADVSSRSFIDKRFTTSHKSFLHIFSSLFPLPQKKCWLEYTHPIEWTSLVMSCLRGKPSTMASWTKTMQTGANIGTTGKPSAPTSRLTPSSTIATRKRKQSSPQDSLLGSGKVTMDGANRSEFRALRSRFRPSQRQQNWLHNPARSSKHRKLTPQEWHGC